MQQINHTLTYEKLGTHRYILFYQPVEQDFLQLLDEQIVQYLTRFEQEYSRFRADSLLTTLATHGYIEHPSQELIDMFHFAIETEEKVMDIFLVLLADTLAAHGYGHHILTPSNHDIKPLRDVLTITPSRITLEPGYTLDFGGFGKGWAVDAVAEILQTHGITYALVNGGGDIRVLDNPTGYEIVIEDPLHDDKALGTISLTQGGCAASSPQRRQRKKDGQTHHHLIDPHTKKPVTTDRLAVHTYATNARMADVASTILYVCPPDQISSILSQLGVECLIILDDYSSIQSPGYPSLQVMS